MGAGPATDVSLRLGTGEGGVKRAIQEMIAWAESQATVRRNTREKCLELQRAKLRSVS
jgi:uncharacterized protein (UPF0548 family)